MVYLYLWGYLEFSASRVLSEKAHACAQTPLDARKHTHNLSSLAFMGGRQQRKKKSSLQAVIAPSLLIPLSHWTGSAYSAAPGSGEWEEKRYYDSEERKEREREKRGADRVL